MATKDVPVERRPVGAAVVGGLARLGRRVGFWGAVVLPLAYGPLLYGGLDAVQLRILAAVVLANVACLVVGREHARTG